MMVPKTDDDNAPKPGSAILCVAKDSSSVLPSPGLPNPWEIVRTSSPEAGLQALGDRTFAAVATDLKNSADSSSFLSNVMERFPQPARILLFNPAEKKPIQTTGGVVHQCLTSP